MLAAISQGHDDLADVLFLVAFILFAIVFIVRLVGENLHARLDLLAAGFACLALAWLVL